MKNFIKPMNIPEETLEDVQLERQGFQKTLRNLRKKSKHVFILAITILALGAVTAGVVFVQVAQELRSDAAMAVPGGFPITVVPSATPLQINQPATLRFQINTQDVKISGIQLSFVVDSSVQNIQLNSIPGAPLNIATHTTNQVERGTLVTFIAIPPTVQAFSSATDVAFAELSFTPTQEGARLLEYDLTRTKITLFGDTDLTNQVAQLSDVSFQVAAAPLPTAVATATNTVAPPTSTPLATAQPTKVPPTSTPSPTAVPVTAVPTSTPRPTIAPPTSTPLPTVGPISVIPLPTSVVATQPPVVTQPVATVTSVPTATLTQAPLPTPTPTPSPRERRRERIIRFIQRFFRFGN